MRQSQQLRESKRFAVGSRVADVVAVTYRNLPGLLYPGFSPYRAVAVSGGGNVDENRQFENPVPLTHSAKIDPWLRPKG